MNLSNVSLNFSGTVPKVLPCGRVAIEGTAGFVPGVSYSSSANIPLARPFSASTRLALTSSALSARNSNFCAYEFLVTSEPSSPYANCTTDPSQSLTVWS